MRLTISCKALPSGRTIISASSRRRDLWWRSEAYLYFDLAEDARVFHMMGEPSETRHLVVANEQAILSPGWSIHAGAGTSSYGFVWGMAGDNQDYTDVDLVAMSTLR